MVGLGNVDNTSDLDKPISNAGQTALDAIKEYAKQQKALEETIAVSGGVGDYQQYLFDKADKFITLQEHLIDMQYKGQLKSIETQASGLQDTLDTLQTQEKQINDKYVSKNHSLDSEYYFAVLVFHDFIQIFFLLLF